MGWVVCVDVVVYLRFEWDCRVYSDVCGLEFFVWWFFKDVGSDFV